MVTQVSGLVRNWNFVSSKVPVRLTVRRFIKLVTCMKLRPRHVAIKPITLKTQWYVYFIYCTDGQLSKSHLFTLARLRDLGGGVLVICAAPTACMVPAELTQYADGLYWKELSGFDFSAYCIALEAISISSAGANVFIMNDSVYGPFYDVRPFVWNTCWQLAGFTASSQIENHIQSYAFGLSEVNPIQIQQLSSVLYPFISFNKFEDVILMQESRFARTASSFMTTGAHWFADSNVILDPMLIKPFELLSTGFPFLKKSLLGKKQNYVDADAVKARLFDFNHPI